MPTKSLHQLADGRDIVFFDDVPGRTRAPTDIRELPEAVSRSELRHDPLTDEWIVIASHRQGRTHLPPTDQCPLCPSRNGRLTEIPSDDYDVVVFENRFPSLNVASADVIKASDEAMTAVRPGVGRCEVVCFTSDHDASFASLSPRRVRTVVDAWADRTAELSRFEGVEQVFLFENRGEEIGVTLRHPHGQIYAYPFVTPRTRRLLDSARTYRERTWRDLFADLLASEFSDGRRIVTRQDGWTAFVPAAARWPFEVHIYPERRVADLPELDDDERDGFATIYLDVLRRFDALFDMPMPYIAAWHQAPAQRDRDLAWLHLELFSIRRAQNKLKYLAGSESGMGVFINDISPETAADMLRGI